MTGIQTLIGNYVLKWKIQAKKRSAELMNIKQVGNICLLVDHSFIENHRELDQAREKLSDFVENVDIIIYSNNKSLPQEYTGSRYNFLINKDLNFFKIPKKEVTGEWRGLGYDVLLVFNPGSQFPLHYLTAELKARLKIGMNELTNPNLIEFNINVKKQSLNHFIDVAISYLNQINKKQRL